MAALADKLHRCRRAAATSPARIKTVPAWRSRTATPAVGIPFYWIPEYLEAYQKLSSASFVDLLLIVSKVPVSVRRA
jgi:hypothetical protein